MTDPAVFAELAACQARGGGVVSYDYDLPVPLDCGQVVFDREDNPSQAARHLLVHGHG